MMLTIIILAACLLMEAFFSGGELALIAADKVRLRHLAERATPRRRRMILAFLDEPGELISASLTGTNICVVLSTVTATVALLPRFPGHAELISLAVMTPLVLVFGEIVPKSVFQHFADRTAPRLIFLMSAFRLLFLPVVSLGRRLSIILLRLFRVEQSRSLMTRDELRLLIKLPSRPGADRITADERKMIARVFDFSTMTVGDVMLPLSELTAISIEASLEEVAREISEKQHTRLPVYRERVDQIEGIIHSFDVLRADRGGDLASLCRPAIFVPEKQPAVDTLVQMQREGQHMAVVVDEYGGAVGVVTIDDILEEVVGEIRDEYDAEEVELVRREPGGVFRVQGRTEVERLNSVARIYLPPGDDYETVAGLVLDQFRRIPEVGEQVQVAGVQIVVTKANERAVEELLIKPRRR